MERLDYRDNDGMRANTLTWFGWPDRVVHCVVYAVLWQAEMNEIPHRISSSTIKIIKIVFFWWIFSFPPYFHRLGSLIGINYNNPRYKSLFSTTKYTFSDPILFRILEYIYSFLFCRGKYDEESSSLSFFFQWVDSAYGFHDLRGSTLYKYRRTPKS